MNYTKNQIIDGLIELLENEKLADDADMQISRIEIIEAFVSKNYKENSLLTPDDEIEYITDLISDLKKSKDKF